MVVSACLRVKQENENFSKKNYQQLTILLEEFYHIWHKFCLYEENQKKHIMNQKLFALVTAFVLISITSEAQVSLKYKWETGATYRFQANQKDDITVSAMGMNMNDIFNTETVFSLKVSDVLADGKAQGVLFIESFQVTNKSGALVASLKDIPNEALKSIVEVDTSGKFTFKKIVYLIVEDGRNMLVSAEAKAGQNSASGSAQIGDQKLSVHAEFDPKSGTIKAGYSMETVKKPSLKTVKVTKDAQKIDVLPLTFLDMLVLPEETITPGDSYQVKMMEYVFTTKVQEITSDLASLALNIKTDRSQGSSTDHMDSMMGDMGGTDMVGGMSMDMSGGAPKTDINGDIFYTFDIDKGIFNNLSGTITNKVKGMGLNMTGVTTLKLILL